MGKTLTREDYQKRSLELQEAERLAEDALRQAAFEQETGTGDSGAVEKAKLHRNTIRDRRETLTLAFKQSEKDQAKAAVDRRNQDFDEWKAKVGADLKERAEIVASIVDHSDKLGGDIKRYFELQDLLKRSAHDMARRHGTYVEGFLNRMSAGHDIRLAVGTTIDANHNIRLLYEGNRHSFRGEDPRDHDAKLAKAQMDHVLLQDPRKGDD